MISFEDEKYQARIHLDAAVKQFAHSKKIGGEMWGLPEVLAEYDLERAGDEGCWLPTLEKSIECAFGKLILANGENFARYAQWLIQQGATSPDSKVENALTDGYSYARGYLPRWISEEEANHEFNIRHPECAKLPEGHSANEFSVAVIKDIKNKSAKSYPDYSLAELPNAPEGKPYLQRFELELWMSWQASAAYYKFVPFILDDENHENDQYVWHYHAREIGHKGFDIGEPGLVNRNDDRDRNYAGSTEDGFSFTVKDGFYHTKRFSRVFNMLFMNVQHYLPILVD